MVYEAVMGEMPFKDTPVESIPMSEKLRTQVEIFTALCYEFIPNHDMESLVHTLGAHLETVVRPVHPDIIAIMFPEAGEKEVESKDPIVQERVGNIRKQIAAKNERWRERNDRIESALGVNGMPEKDRKRLADAIHAVLRTEFFKIRVRGPPLPFPEDPSEYLLPNLLKLPGRKTTLERLEALLKTGIPEVTTEEPLQSLRRIINIQDQEGQILELLKIMIENHPTNLHYEQDKLDGERMHEEAVEIKRRDAFNEANGKRRLKLMGDVLDEKQKSQLEQDISSGEKLERDRRAAFDEAHKSPPELPRDVEQQRMDNFNEATGRLFELLKGPQQTSLMKESASDLHERTRTVNVLAKAAQDNSARTKGRISRVPSAGLLVPR